MDPEEERARMRALHRQVMTHDVDRWARSFLDFLDPAGAEAWSPQETLDERQITVGAARAGYSPRRWRVSAAGGMRL